MTPPRCVGRGGRRPDPEAELLAPHQLEERAAHLLDQRAVAPLLRRELRPVRLPAAAFERGVAVVRAASGVRLSLRLPEQRAERKRHLYPQRLLGPCVRLHQHLPLVDAVLNQRRAVSQRRAVRPDRNEGLTIGGTPSAMWLLSDELRPTSVVSVASATVKKKNSRQRTSGRGARVCGTHTSRRRE